jgi:hypothetical protein
LEDTATTEQKIIRAEIAKPVNDGYSHDSTHPVKA